MSRILTPTLLLILLALAGCKNLDVGGSVSYKPRADLPELKMTFKAK